MRCFFQRWCRRKPENCALYWEGRLDEKVLQATIPIFKALKKASRDPAFLAGLHEWNPYTDEENEDK